jgi:hypothetical protein
MFNIRESPEFAQLVVCCRAAFAQHSQSHAVLRPDVDWNGFLHLARRHRVQGLIWRSLHKVGDNLPPEVRDSLEDEARNVAKDGLESAIECSRLLKAMSCADIPILFLKGLPLGKLAYGDPFVKMSWDVDILVSREHLSAAASTLETMDYELIFPRPTRQARQLEHWHSGRKESVWRRRRDNIHVELHTRLTDNPRLLPKMGVASARQLVSVTPGIALPTLAEEGLFAYLCVHGASSAWFRLKWLADLASLLSRYRSERISELYKVSQGLGAGRAPAQALLISRDVFGTHLEPSLARELETNSANRLLAAVARRQLARLGEPTSTKFGTATIHLSQVLLQPGAKFKLGELRRQLADAAGNRFKSQRGE